MPDASDESESTLGLRWEHDTELTKLVEAGNASATNMVLMGFSMGFSFRRFDAIHLSISAMQAEKFATII